ncbi:putative adhesin [Endozoicomonas euniceicola]|uniref:Putative adhesin Stv domain-containing protein n=1 Tax=Endozoicomonas euniceicola TaxID=1234143 RepID=A0ABY6H0P5_9GAMM|nr:hypothetical protein [Endozoicomonas euniceicola]UYM18625.1 hypothetical protein NX720_12225 [Endozoicomonas euniceicola]
MPIFTFIPTVKKLSIRNGLKLFTCKTGGRKAQNLIIHCHGTFRLEKPGSLMPSDITTVPPGTSLYFYAPHGAVLHNSLDRLMSGVYEPLEVIMAGQPCANYLLVPELHKAWGSEDFVKATIMDDRTSPGKKAKKHPLREFDVVLVSHDIRLGKLIETLQLEGQLYPRTHCSFCRDSARGLVLRGYDPEFETPPNVYQGDLGRWHIL